MERWKDSISELRSKLLRRFDWGDILTREVNHGIIRVSREGFIAGAEAGDLSFQSSGFPRGAQ